MKKFNIRPKIGYSGRVLIGDENSANKSVYLGRLAETGALTKVYFDVSTPHVITIFGKRGSGKSYTLGSLLEGLCTSDLQSSISTGDKNQAVLLFDTLGIFQWMDVPLSGDSPQQLIREQFSHLRGWDFRTESLNVKIWSPNGVESPLRDYEKFSVNCADFNASDWGYLLGLDVIQDRMGQLINDAYEKVVHEGWATSTKSYEAQVQYTIEDLMDCIQNDMELNDSYHSETKRAVVQQLSVYSRSPLFQPKRKKPSQTEPNAADNLSEGTALPQVLKKGQLSVLLLHRLSEELRFVIIIALIRKIMESRIRTSEIEKSSRVLPSDVYAVKANQAKLANLNIPPTWIVVDEAQNFLPSEHKTSATDILVKLVREGRNVGLSFVLTTQQPTAIDQRILSQADTMICQKLTVENDIEYVRRNMKSALPQEIAYGNTSLSLDGLLRLLDTGQSIISNTETERAFIVEIRPRVSVHGGFGI